MARIFYMICFFVLASLLIVEKSRAECDFGCGLYYKPICAKDAEGNVRQFANDCELSWARCKTPTKKYEVLKKGECEEQKAEKKDEKIEEKKDEKIVEKKDEKTDEKKDETKGKEEKKVK